MVLITSVPQSQTIYSMISVI